MASPVQVSIVEYLLRISEKCEICGRMMWIYRSIGEVPYFFRIFSKTFDFNPEAHYTEENILLMWSRVVKLWLRTNLDEDVALFKPDLNKFTDLLMKTTGTH